MDISDKGSLGAELSLNYNALSAMQSRYVLLCNELYIDESFCDDERAELLKACDSEQEIIERVQQYLERHSNYVAGVIIEGVYDKEKTATNGKPPVADLSEETINAIERHNEQQYERVNTLRNELHENALQNRSWWQKLLNVDPPPPEFF